MIKLADSNFKEEVLDSELPVLVDFWASWCPPCKMMEPMIDKLAAECEGKAKLLKINVDQNKLSASEYSIGGVPTFVLFKDGKEVERVVGAQTESTLKKMLDI